MRRSGKFFICTFALTLCSALSIPAHAQTGSQHIIVAPQCLLQTMQGDYKTLSSQDSLSLLAVDEAGINQLIRAKHQQKKLCGGFMDVTRAWQTHKIKGLSAASTAAAFLKTYSGTTHSTLAAKNVNYTIQHEEQVQQLFKQINPQNMLDYLTTLTGFQDRYANSEHGVKAAGWIKSQVETIAEENHRDDVNVYTIATGTRYKQPSVIAKVGTSTGPGVVIGAHMDTLNGSFSKKPGADDDGSGSATVLETVRTLLSSGMRFKKPLYFIWYAAEEEGLVGSDFVVAEFKKNNIPVEAVLHFDLTGYAYRNEPTMWLIDDYVNKTLVDFLGNLISNYVKQPVKHTRCGYACSDHASWTQNGYAAAIPAEAAYENSNPDIHTTRDTMDKLSVSHMTDYLKLATAFAVEAAEPVT
ncbi:Bacterial leucyl aminopeptidase [Aquicella siphonis]|uniref:Bacterial leucyl aminopeptidase n=1 Tax=Aquicella siphonis TaxID=254247 RepID=A0A5E4PKD7_9COXI|nr:M20/M25/M40 family metallo-hydrolase [Aquicella siphonis]VVC76742.1 Bacterial leucyl aminopeptidase [Aquicella siphonis]